MTRQLKVFAAAMALLSSPAAILVSCSSDNAVTPVDAGHDVIEERVVKDTGPDLVAIPIDDGGLSFNLWPPGEGPLVYWGGPVMLGSPNVYFIWYGDWKGSNTPAILEDLIKGFNGTAYAGIMKAYYQIAQAPLTPPTDAGLEAGDAGLVGDSSDAARIPDGPREALSGEVTFDRSLYVGYTHGKDLHDSDIKLIVQELLRSGDLPYDANGLYFVLTSNDVTERTDSNWAGYCTDYCGWHDGTFIDQVQIHYSFIGSGCTQWCSVQPNFVEAGIPSSPNGNWDADGMASVIIHEMCESLSDPQPEYGPGWLDSYQLNENGDMCAWRFDPTYPTLAGSRANVRFGQRDFLIQQMWVLDDDGGRCDLQK